MATEAHEVGPLSDGTRLEFATRMATFSEHEIGIPTPDGLAAAVAQIYERAQRETVALLQSRPVEKVVISVQEWMTASQLADYWQLYNEKNEPTTAGIVKWSKRPPDQFPLPHAYMGDLLRFNRDEVDGWAHEEAERRRVQKEKRRLRIA